MSRVKETNKHSTWRKVQIGKALRLINGRAFKPREWADSGLPIVRIQNLNNPEAPFNYYQGHLPEKFQLDDGDLLFAWSGTPGTSFGAHIWQRGKAWLNQHIFKVLFDDRVFDKRFLRLAINQNLAEYIRAAHGAAGLAHITKGKFEESWLPQPPITEQKQIVAEIEKQFTRLDAGVAALKKTQTNLKRYRAAVLKAACEGKLVPNEAELARKEGRDFETGERLLARILEERRNKWQGRGKYKEPVAPDTADLPPVPEGWVWATVGQLSLKIQYGHTASAVNREQGIRFLRITDIQDNRVDWSKVPSCDIPEADISDMQLCSGDIVFARTGATVGKSYQLKQPFPPSVFASYLIRINPVTSDISNWLYTFFQSPSYWSQIQDSASGIGQPNVNAAKLQLLRIPFPSHNEQKRILAEVDRCLSVAEELDAVVSANLQRAGRLRQSVLRKAFKGAQNIEENNIEEPL